MSFTIPKGQTISFDSETCNDYCAVYSNRSSCGEILSNELFLNGVDDWDLGSNTQVQSTSPVIIENLIRDIDANISQTITLNEGVEYIVKYSYVRLDESHSFQDQIDLSDWGLSLTTLDEGIDVNNVTGSLIFTPTTTATGVFDFIFRGGAVTEIQLNYIKLCLVEDEVDNTDCEELCFKVKPGYSSHNYLGGYDGNYGQTYEDDTDGSHSTDTTAVTTFTVVDDIYEPLTTIGVAGLNYWGECYIENLDITWGTSDDDLIDKNLRIDFIAPSQTVDFTYLNSGSYSGAKISNVQLGDIDTRTVIQAELNGSDYTVKYDFDNISHALILMEKEIYIPFEVGIYKISFDMPGTSGVTVKISGITPYPDEFEFYETGSSFEKVFESDTAGVKIITLAVDDFTEESYGDKYDVLTNLSLVKQCEISADVYNDSDVLQGGMDLQLIETSEIQGSSLSEFVEFCYDLNQLVGGKYYIKLLDECNPYTEYLSNCFEIANNAEDLINLSYSQDVVIGTDELTISGCVWLRSSLQEPIIEDTRETYQYSTGYMAIPYVFNRTNRTFQVFPVPEFMREALAVAFMGTFQLDGVDYQKLKDEDITMMFTSKHEAPIRVLVHKVGDFARTSF
ncbi:MAG: hypothetical protein GY756_26935 [bacterium]|nr:hypothetical protein [bacterium]